VSGGPLVRSDDSLLIFAPHPDDETLAGGGLIQRALSVRARVHVSFATEGENNPWPQRVLERRWSIGPSDRRRFGALRRGEASVALRTLGLVNPAPTFLGLPDQGITERLMRDPQPAIAAILREIAEHQPSVILVPSPRDGHPDHSALGVLVRQALRVERRTDVRLLHFRIHGGRPSPPGASMVLALRAEERERKRHAIESYRSQLVFRRRFFRSFAAAEETFEDWPGAAANDASHTIPASRVDERGLRLEIRSRSWLRRPLAKHVLLAGWKADGTPIHAILRVERGESRLPIERLGEPPTVFVKLEHRGSFFDEDGWRELECFPVGAATGARSLAPPARRAAASRALLR
jgi:LmbE family N-acetylglucosaminyl deacetylase